MKCKWYSKSMMLILYTHVCIILFDWNLSIRMFVVQFSCYYVTRYILLSQAKSIH
jgi:hypothetical protein